DDTATTELCTLSLHDALPISKRLVVSAAASPAMTTCAPARIGRLAAEGCVTSLLNVSSCPLAAFLLQRFAASRVSFFPSIFFTRSEEHTSELQSRENLVCRLL